MISGIGQSVVGLSEVAVDHIMERSAETDWVTEDALQFRWTGWKPDGRGRLHGQWYRNCRMVSAVCGEDDDDQAREEARRKALVQFLRESSL